MKRLRSTLVLIVVAAGLGAYIYFVESERAPASETTPKAKVFTVESDAIQELEITSSKGETTTLSRQEGQWKITAPAAADADSSEISSITSSLASLENQRTVEENATDLVPFGLEPARIQVAFKTDPAGQPTRLLLGSKTPTGSDMYAKKADSPDVFLVSGYLDTTFDRNTFDVRDKSVLKFDRNAVSSLTVEAPGQPRVELSKSGSDWTMKAPWQSRGDYGAIEGLVGRVASGQMKTLVTESADDLGKFGLDKPAVTVTVGAGSAQASLAIGSTTEDAGFYARDASRNLVFTVDQAFVDELRKAPHTFRPKDLFDFRTFTGDRLEIARGDSSTVFERLKREGENAAETWKQTSPALDVPESKITDFLSKISTLRADDFVDALPARRDEVARVTTRYGTDGKEERVTFFKAGTDILATRPNESGAARLAGTAFGEALAALDQVTPDPPATTGSTPEEKK